MGHFEVDFSGASDRWTGGCGGFSRGWSFFNSQPSHEQKGAPGDLRVFFLGGMTVTTQFHIGVIIYHYSRIPMKHPIIPNSFPRLLPNTTEAEDVFFERRRP